jgi:hypothetical protein
MNKAEAIAAMKAGHKVTHYMWANNEYILIDNGIVYNECDESHGTIEIFTECMYVNTAWQHDWSTYKDKI